MTTKKTTEEVANKVRAELTKEKLLKQIEKTIYEGYEVVLWPDDIEEKDINDMILAGRKKEEIQTIIEKNSYQGNMAMIRFATWRRRNA